MRQPSGAVIARGAGSAGAGLRLAARAGYTTVRPFRMAYPGLGMRDINRAQCGRVACTVAVTDIRLRPAGKLLRRS
jgi:hypothetical protein